MRWVELLGRWLPGSIRKVGGFKRDQPLSTEPRGLGGHSGGGPVLLPASVPDPYAARGDFVQPVHHLRSGWPDCRCHHWGRDDHRPAEGQRELPHLCAAQRYLVPGPVAVAQRADPRRAEVEERAVAEFAVDHAAVLPAHRPVAADAAPGPKRKPPGHVRREEPG